MVKQVDYRIRQCAPGDEASLSLAGSAAFLEAFAGTLDAPDILAHAAANISPAYFAKHFADATSRAALAEVAPGNAPVGYILCCEPDLPVPLTTQDYELRRIYLLHRFQGTGIGRALMDRAVEFARELGKTRLLLGVYGKNDAAIAFYRKAGFEEIGRRTFTVGSTTHDDAVMARAVGD